MGLKTKLQKILEGWHNVIFENPEIERLAKGRAEICAECKMNIMNTCMKCGCPLVAKLRSKESDCPLKLW